MRQFVNDLPDGSRIMDQDTEGKLMPLALVQFENQFYLLGPEVFAGEIIDDFPFLMALLTRFLN
ncbi:hypothetical protein [Candidatus Symbiopectobacterium sp.]|uniref:hypothetical protein n=1 Tax=Candidatus Symbiopectobacterium sp. TaxID=2816440 RepID=UPI0025BFEB22|nr:hypothetical protein [Candidatus Symbiopectobacterium sp.]